VERMRSGARACRQKSFARGIGVAGGEAVGSGDDFVDDAEFFLNPWT